MEHFPFIRSKIESRAVGGFTLLELLLVCAIIIVMMATVSASMGGMMNRSHLRGVTARISSQAVFARSHALTSGRKVVMEVNSQAGEISLLQPEEKSEALTLIDASWQLRLPQGIAIDSLEIDGQAADQGQIAFYPEGGAQAALIVLGMTGEGRREQRSLEINKITGRMKVE